MRIAADGRWFHQGGLITRPAMVRAFSHLLRRDADGSHWLVTPYEKLSIEVEDAPFIAVEMQQEGAGADSRIAFRLNNDDLVILGPANPLTMRNGPDGLLPYIHVRDGLEARLSRPVYYELAEQALTESEDAPVIWSGGKNFPLSAAA